MSDSEAIVRRLFDRVEAKDLDAVAALFAEDAVFVDCSDPAVVEGRAAIASMIAEMWVGLPDFRVDEVINLVSSDGLVLAELELVGTHGGEYLGHPATGAAVRWRTAVVYEVDTSSGQIKREAYYYDSARLLAQLGARA
jgi:steroid delta-isomerase-like uncharacterized protein